VPAAFEMRKPQFVAPAALRRAQVTPPLPGAGSVTAAQHGSPPTRRFAQVYPWLLTASLHTSLATSTDTLLPVSHTDAPLAGWSMTFGGGTFTLGSAIPAGFETLIITLNFPRPPGPVAGTLAKLTQDARGESTVSTDACWARRGVGRATRGPKA